MRGLIVIPLAMVVAACGSFILFPSPTPRSPTPSRVTPSLERLDCRPDPGLPADAARRACDLAIAAAQATVAQFDQTIARIFLKPGQGECGGIWPGLGSPPPVCFGPMEIAGASMHGWVSFADTDKVAALHLNRDIAGVLASPSLAPDWTTTVLDFAVPPTGWRMPETEGCSMPAADCAPALVVARAELEHAGHLATSIMLVPDTGTCPGISNPGVCFAVYPPDTVRTVGWAVVTLTPTATIWLDIAVQQSGGFFAFIATR